MVHLQNAVIAVVVNAVNVSMPAVIDAEQL